SRGRGAGAPGSDHDGGQGRRAGLVDPPAGGRRADGVQQLHFAFLDLQFGLLRLRARDVRAFRAISAVLRSGTDLVVQPGLESHLAKAFPLRAARVVLAFADLLEEAADADQKRACDDAHHRRDIPVGECVADRRPELPATPSALKSGTWGGAGRQTCRLERDRGDLALKSSFVPLGGRTGLIAHPRMYRVVLRQPHLMTRATDSQRLKPKVRHVSCRSFVTSNSADGEFHDRGYCDSLTVSTWSASTFS